MQITPLHSWDVTPAEAVALQRELAGRIDVRTPLPDFDLVAGADISYNRYNPLFFATVIVYRVSDNTIVETQETSRLSTFPYVSGLLSFREAPALLDAFAKVKTKPDVIMIDGQGIAHPRRMGIAAHMGLFLDFPCFGCAKSLLAGKFTPPAPQAGSMSPLKIGDEQVGYVVRTKSKVNPVFISAGHKIDLASAVKVVNATVRGYRIPEPTRLAHLRVNAVRRGEIPLSPA